LRGLKGLWSFGVTHCSGRRTHNRARNGWGAIMTFIDYPRGAYLRSLGGSLPWFVSLMMICTLIGFACMTLLGLL
jgi:hypothetical protein